jgi:hypothetical protein
MRLSWSLPVGLLALVACGGAGAAVTPSMPAEAMLDAFDGAVLGATAQEAPAFEQVAAPRDDLPRRFRGWLGWTRPQCEACPPDQTATCVPRCTEGKPFVCERPARMVACTPDETVSTMVDDADGPVPAAGVYVFEGRWHPEGFAVEKIAPMPWPPKQAD